MDLISTFILTQIADAIIGKLVDEGSQEVISKLQGVSSLIKSYPSI